MVRTETGIESDMEGSGTTGGQLGPCPRVTGYVMVQKIKTVIMLTFLHSCLAGFEAMGVRNCAAEDTSAQGSYTRNWRRQDWNLGQTCCSLPTMPPALSGPTQ